MPVFRSGHGLAPQWCELEFFEIVRLAVGESHEFEWIGAKEKLIVGAGDCRIASAGGVGEVATKGANLDLTEAGGTFRVTEVNRATILIRMCGHWGDRLGGSGLFTGATKLPTPSFLSCVPSKKFFKGLPCLSFSNPCVRL